MTHISKLRNLGPKSAEWLEQVGIATIEQLGEIGVVEAYLRVKTAMPKRASLNLLYGMQAGMMNIHWKDLPPDMRQALKAQAETAQKKK